MSQFESSIRAKSIFQDKGIIAYFSSIVVNVTKHLVIILEVLAVLIKMFCIRGWVNVFNDQFRVFM